MVSFISRHVQGIDNPLVLLSEVGRILKDKSRLFTWLRDLLPDKRERYREFSDLIRIHMPSMLQKEFAPDKLQPLEENKSWDDYISSLGAIIKKNPNPYGTALIDASRDLVQEIRETSQASVEKIDELKKRFIDYIEISSVRGGLVTAFQNIYGLLRVIPILAQQATGKFIDKAELVANITGKTTQRLLKKIMVLNGLTMNALINILWQRPVESLADAREKFDNYENIYDLTLLSFFSPTTRLYHPSNFELKNDGIDFNASGEHYYEAANELHQDEKTGGCPANQVDGAVAGVCQLVGQIINLIPDDRFKALIEAPRTSYDTIRRQVNIDAEETIKERKKHWTR